MLATRMSRSRRRSPAADYRRTTEPVAVSLSAPSELTPSCYLRDLRLRSSASPADCGRAPLGPRWYDSFVPAVPVTRLPFALTETSVLAIIPARYHSTRLPGKALLDICGRPMIEHVYRRASAAARSTRVLVATDDERIARAVEAFGGVACMTSPAHRVRHRPSRRGRGRRCRAAWSSTSRATSRSSIPP